MYLKSIFPSMFRALNLEVFALIGCYAVYVGSCLPTFRAAYHSHLQGSSSPKRMPGIRWIRYYVGDGVGCDVCQGVKRINQINRA
jgi:hypothetical protein